MKWRILTNIYSGYYFKILFICFKGGGDFVQEVMQQYFFKILITFSLTFD